MFLLDFCDKKEWKISDFRCYSRVCIVNPDFNRDKAFSYWIKLDKNERKNKIIHLKPCENVQDFTGFYDCLTCKEYVVRS